MRVIVRFFFVLAVLFIAACNRDPTRQRDKYFTDAERYLASNRYSEASIQFRNALQIDAGHIPSYLGLAEALKKSGENEEALNTYRKVVSLDPSNIDARVEVGRYFLQAAARQPEFFKTAESIAREIISLQPSNMEGQVLLGNAYSGLGDVDESIRTLEAAVSQDPEHLQAAISLAAAKMRANHLDEAERLFQWAAEKHPDSIEALLSIATFLAGIQRNSEAEKYFKKAFELSPDDPKSLYGLTSFYSSNKKVTEVEDIFKQAITRRPDAREPYWGLADFYFRQGNEAKATNALMGLLKVNPRDRQAQVRLAETYLNANEPLKAEEMLRSSLDAFPNDAEGHALMGRLLRERNDAGGAIAHLDSAIKFDESLIPPYIEKANLQMMAGQIAGASQTLSMAQQQNRNNMLVRGFLAKLFALQQKPEDALREAAAVLTAMPTNEDAMVARGDALVQLGKHEEAVKQFRQLTTLRPKYSFYWHRLGVVEAVRGDSVNAVVHLRKAIELKPDLAPAINDLVRFQSQLKQFDAAIGDLDRLPASSIPAHDIHSLRGRVYAAKGDAVAAEREFRKAIELNPSGYTNYMALAELGVTRKDLTQAMREVDRLIASNGRLPQAFFMKAYLSHLMNDTAGAIANYRKALELDPENPEAANNLAWLLSDDPAYLAEALNWAVKARRSKSADPEMADTLGWVYYKMKNYGLAVDQLLFSVNNRPQPEAEHYYRLGLAYQAHGDVEQAKTVLRRALQVSPSFPDAVNARRILEERR